MFIFLCIDCYINKNIIFSIINQNDFDKSILLTNIARMNNRSERRNSRLKKKKTIIEEKKSSDEVKEKDNMFM